MYGGIKMEDICCVYNTGMKNDNALHNKGGDSEMTNVYEAVPCTIKMQKVSANTDI